MVSRTFEHTNQAACADDRTGYYVDERAQHACDEPASLSLVRSDRAPAEMGLLEHSLGTYVTQLGQTPVLNASEERLLGKHIEQGKYLSRVQQELLSSHGTPPVAAEVFLAMAEHVAASGQLFQALCLELDLPSGNGIGHALLCPRLRGAIDGYADPGLVQAVGNAMGTSPEPTLRALIEFSLASGLVPWHSLGELAALDGIEQLRNSLQSPQHRHRLQDSEPELERHLTEVYDESQHAFDHLVRANLRLVIALAKRYASAYVPFADLVQEGTIGLLRAADKFDHRRGHRFSTYATWWIRHSLGHATAEQSRPFRLPVHTMDKIGTLHKVEERLSQRYGRLPGRDELAREMGIKPQKVDELRYAASPGVISLQAAVAEGEEETELADTIEDRATPSPVDQAGENLLRQQLDGVLQSLAARERRVVQLRFGFSGGRSHTLAETGAELGVSKQRVQQIESKALATLREHSGIRVLRDYLS